MVTLVNLWSRWWPCVGHFWQAELAMRWPENGWRLSAWPKRNYCCNTMQRWVGGLGDVCFEALGVRVKQLLMQILVVAANMQMRSLKTDLEKGFANCTVPLCFVVCSLLVFPDVMSMLCWPVHCHCTACTSLATFSFRQERLTVCSVPSEDGQSDTFINIHASCWPVNAVSWSTGFMWTAFGMKQGRTLTAPPGRKRPQQQKQCLPKSYKAQRGTLIHNPPIEAKAKLSMWRLCRCHKGKSV